MIKQINTITFNVINHFAGRNIVIDKLGILIAEYLPIVFVLFLIYLWFNRNKKKELALYSGYSVILGISLNFLITLFYFHPRPFMDKIGILLINHAPETSFPSDHTTFMLSIAFTLFYFKNTRKLGIIFSILGILGGISRIFCGLHYPFDIIGSILVAIISSFSTFVFKEKLQKFNNLIINLYYKVLKHEN
jgi:undecaprenyl-diphosphatase